MFNLCELDCRRSPYIFNSADMPDEAWVKMREFISNVRNIFTVEKLKEITMPSYYDGTNVVPIDEEYHKYKMIQDFWANITPDVTVAVIPDGFVEIPEEAFAGCSELRSVFIPDSVTTIGRGASAL